MKLYHGSNMVVEKPEIRSVLRAMDFGAGFYTTSSREQAENWACSVTKRRRTGEPVVNIYEFDEEMSSLLSQLIFDGATEAWLDFVVSNRRNQFTSLPYDIVIGPVANDSTLRVIDDYMDGHYTKIEAINHLLPQNLKDQYAFLTSRALSCLRFKELIYV